MEQITAIQTATMEYQLGIGPPEQRCTYVVPGDLVLSRMFHT